MSVAAVMSAETAASAAACPPCPACGEGHLLGLHSGMVYVCTTPACTYTISANGTAMTYYKGHAVAETKEKGEKRWVEFKF